MIGNARRADLLECRRQTLQIMKDALEKLKWVKDPKVREDMLESIKELGLIAQKYKEMIEFEDKNGVPEKWVQYHKTLSILEKNLGKLYARNK